MRPQNMRNFSIGAVAAAFVLAACARHKDDTPKMNSGMTPAELAAKFPADLGPGTVDVSSYPQDIQKNYKVFLAVCSACHSPARPLNSPVSSATDWKRFVHRMHVKMENRGYILSPEDEKKIVEFLTYDSKIRKIGKKKEFEARREALEVIFQQVLQERNRLLEEETKRLARKDYDYFGVK